MCARCERNTIRHFFVATPTAETSRVISACLATLAWSPVPHTHSPLTRQNPQRRDAVHEAHLRMHRAGKLGGSCCALLSALVPCNRRHFWSVRRGANVAVKTMFVQKQFCLLLVHHLVMPLFQIKHVLPPTRKIRVQNKRQSRYASFYGMSSHAPDALAHDSDVTYSAQSSCSVKLAAVRRILTDDLVLLPTDASPLRPWELRRSRTKPLREGTVREPCVLTHLQHWR